VNSKVEEILNQQIAAEAESSQLYLSMASWAEVAGINGTAQFLYKHSDEEREHMLKLIKFVNERGGTAVITKIDAPIAKFKSPVQIFDSLLAHEIKGTEMINKIVHLCLEEKDYTTHNFMQWFLAEQLEEEALAREIVDRLRLIGDDKGGLYLFDRDLEQLETKDPEA